MDITILIREVADIVVIKKERIIEGESVVISKQDYLSRTRQHYEDQLRLLVLEQENKELKRQVEMLTQQVKRA